jgi:hypothetical protein
MEQQISRNSFPQADWRLRAAVGSCMYAMVRKNIYQGQYGQLTKSGNTQISTHFDSVHILAFVARGHPRPQSLPGRSVRSPLMFTHSLLSRTDFFSPTSYPLLIIDSHIRGQLCRRKQGENGGLTQTDTTDAVLRETLVNIILRRLLYVRNRGIKDMIVHWEWHEGGVSGVRLDFVLGRGAGMTGAGGTLRL